MNYDVSAFVSIPLVDNTLALRVSGGASYNAGYADIYYGASPTGNPDEKDANYSHNQDIRAVLLWKPVSNVSVEAQFWQFRPTQNYINLLTSVDPPYMANTGGVRGFSSGNFRLYSLTTDVDFGDVVVTNIASYVEGSFGNLIPIGGGGTFSSFFYPSNFSDEIRVHSSGGPLHWLVGGAYQDGAGPQKNLMTIPPFVVLNADQNAKSRSGAVFGEVSYDLLDGKLVPLAGLRLYTERRAFADAASEDPVNRDVLTWRFNLSYLPNDNLTMFVTAATGFRPGMIQSKLQADLVTEAGVPAATALNPETLTNYEFGTRWITDDGKLSIAANLYRINLKGLISTIGTANPNVNGYANIGNAHTDGIDLEVNWHTPVKGVSLGFIGNMNDGEFDTVSSVLNNDYIKPGKRLINSIRNNWQVNANYNGKLTDSLDIYGNFSWSQYGNRIASGGFMVGEYGLANATAGLRYETWDLSLVVSNLADERGPSGAFNPTALSGPTPRTVGIRLRRTAE
jgi:outer membrane receptor protein involved in Fe transport